jgi:predicted permease
VDTLLNDVRYAARMAWKSRVVTLVAVASLAAGIGANSAVFSLVNAILLRPRAVATPDRLVELYSGDRQQPYQTSSYPSYLDFRDNNGVFSGLAAYGVAFQFKLLGPTDVEQVWGEVVSGNYFDVLGVRLELGRAFLAEEDRVPNRNPVVVISHSLWQRRFGADPGVLGRSITINNQPLTVIGVAAPQYTGMLRGLASEIWLPAMMLPAVDPVRGKVKLTSRGSKWVTLVGRLAPGVSLDRARARFDVLSRQMQAAHPDEWTNEGEASARPIFVSVLPESETRVHPSARGAAFAFAVLLLVVVALVLLLACLNLASMLFARAVARRTEIAIRLALGADRSRIVRQLVTESVLLSLVAGLCGVVFAFWVIRLAFAFMPALPEGIRLGLDVPLDWRVVLYSMVVATATGVLLGLAPALHGTKAAVWTVLRDQSSGVTARHRTSRVRTWLVTAQVAFSLLLLIGAGLVVRSLDHVRPTRLGFQSANMLVAPVTLSETDYDRTRGHQLYEQLMERVAALPGTRKVSLVDAVPGGFMSRTRRSTEIEGYTPQPNESLEIDASIASPHHFTNLGVPFVMGRDFDERDRDGAPCVAIINEVFARRYFAGVSSPLGRHLAKVERTPAERKVLCQIVGVIRDDRWQSLQDEVRPFFAYALLQSDTRRVTLMAETAGNPAALTASVRQIIRTLDPRMPVADVQTLDAYFSVSLYPFRLLAIVIAACGVMALLLAAIGIYGIVAYSVAQRHREVGIRMALGALGRDILALVIRQGMVPVAYGIAAGLALGLVLARVMSSLPDDAQVLFGVSATDPLTFGGVTAFLGLIALAACYVPARRAAKVDPVVTLRDGS